MSVTLTQVDGHAAVEIEDSRGDVNTYLFQVLVRNGVWSVRLYKLAADRAEILEEYIVSELTGHWWCTCRDWKCRRALRLPQGGCKHIREARELRAFLAALKGEAS